MSLMEKYIGALNNLNFGDMYNNDFFLTWEKTRDELDAVFTVADALRTLRENNVSSRIFDTSATVSGTYFVWNDAIINGRIRITNSRANVGNASQVTGPGTVTGIQP